LDRLTVAEAAERLGVSQDAVRQRIRRGTIDSERTEEGRLYVYLTPEDTKPDWVPYTVQKALVEHLQRENDFLRDFLRKELERKDHLLAAALERIPPALGAPPTAQGSAARPSEKSPKVETTRQPAEGADEGPDERGRSTERLGLNEPSSTQTGGDTQAEETFHGTNRARLGRTAAKAPWATIGLATFLAGAIHPVIMNVVVLGAASVTVGAAINHPPLSFVYLFVYFLVHLLPLPLGIWVGLAWSGRHASAYVLLGIAAGGVEALISLGIVGVAPDTIYLAYEDLIAWFATPILFLSGALYGDLLEARRKMPAASEIVRRGDEAAWNERTRLLIQSIVPALLGLVGTIITALATILARFI
jgi:excisionase family DNA binding protein